ncbi:circularly permuted type 2 ATP-grasp protein [Hoyosella altamirensis]|uniref:Putative circularly permuted ATP-grasp superfamily protein/putative alpha-E superfamily protein n=1 Tax=Hoyosella altamirensis TaxID=616997 RepID=A0A839RV73_9ACTN|nr:circularly permuted type 2 ATP-grasp protein [Hoyosella altamirensis]MBB3039944.1 putative circularly permuted ATP-grasp superfamily protein/putative alpha-E superfamily protein [Hoyosella altamirensis]
MAGERLAPTDGQSEDRRELNEADSILALGGDGLRRLRGRVRRLVANDGITFEAESSAWNLDPIPLVVSAAEWNRLEAAMAQRARLLDALLADLYGEQSVISRGLLPPEMVYGHRGYLRGAHAAFTANTRALFLHSADLARLPGGEFAIISDHAQAPLGVGYALADRKVLSRAMPQLYQKAMPRPLSAFVQVMRVALASVAPGHISDPLVAILSPGPESTASFDHAFLASVLGYPLVESTDLTVRDGRLWMRALGKRLPIDVVVRFVESAATDPLDQRSASRTGVAGLTEMARRGVVSIVNPVGCGVVENVALGSYLPQISRALIDEDLLLDSVPGWWAGTSDGLSYICDHLPDLLLENIRSGESYVGSDLSRAQREELKQRIEADDWQWCAQERPEYGREPIVTAAGGVSSAPVTLRLFSVAQRAGYTTMAGGFAYVPIEQSAGVTVPGIGAAKDIWVQADKRVEGTHPGGVELADSFPDLTAAQHGLPWEGVSSPRVLSDLFWLGRYAEHAEDTARLLNAVRERYQDYRFRPWLPGSGSLGVLVSALATVAGSQSGTSLAPADPVTGATTDASVALAEMRSLTGDGERAGSLAYSVRHLESAARGVRVQLSVDTWMVLTGVREALSEFCEDESKDPVVMAAAHTAVLHGMLALAGLGAESLVRDPGWYLLDIGRRVERGLQLTRLIGASLAKKLPAAEERAVIESILLACESSVMYRRRQHGVVRVAPMAELLVFDGSNPRSLIYQLERLQADFAGLPEETVPVRVTRLITDLITHIRRADPAGLGATDEEGHRTALRSLMQAIASGLGELSEIVEASLLAPPVDMQPLWGSAESAEFPGGVTA